MRSKFTEIMTGQSRIRVFAIVCLVTLLFLLRQEWHGSLSWFPLWLRGLLLVTTAFWTVVAVHMSVVIASPYTAIHVMILQYFFQHVIDFLGWYFTKQLERQTLECQAVQEEFLLSHLKSRVNTKYGKDHNFAAMTSVAEFRQRHPLTMYGHYASYMDRVARGESNVVMPRPPSRLGLTSGTTGKQKLIPTSLKRNLLFIFKYMMLVIRCVKLEVAPWASPLQKTCYLYIHNQPRYSEGGVVMGPTTMLLLPDILHRIQVSTPPAGMRLINESQAMYVHLLFALRDRTLQILSAIFSTNIYGFFLQLEDDWPKFVDDLRRGRIGDRAGLERDVKTTLELDLSPDPERADELEREFRKGFDGIAKRIWPEMYAVMGISSGAMAVYGRRLKEKYTKGIPILSSVYNSTEATIGVMYRSTGHFVILPGDVFYEFIPLEHTQEEQPDTLLAEDVRVGEMYEIVLTNMDALYRYRIGDVVKIAGFHNKAPILDFQYRAGELLNLNGEKTPEISIRGAINDTIALYKGLHLTDYGCVESTKYEEATGSKDSRRAAFYVIILELDGVQELKRDGKWDKNKIVSELDSNLCRHADRYNHHREVDSIAPPRLILVQPRSFSALRDYVLANSKASALQVKIPKLMRENEWIRLLSEKELK